LRQKEPEPIKLCHCFAWVYDDAGAVVPLTVPVPNEGEKRSPPSLQVPHHVNTALKMLSSPVGRL